jgi:ketosteroid isomerase-like protein
MPPDVPRRFGKAEIRREIQPLFDLDGRRELVIQPEEVRILGDHAYVHGTYELKVAPKKAKTGHYTGKFLTILEKQIDGSWKIAVDCFNHNPPSE